jgi:hypothetical protein
MVKLVEGMASGYECPPARGIFRCLMRAYLGSASANLKAEGPSTSSNITVGSQQRKLSLGPVVPGVLGEKRRRASEILTRARVGQDVVAEKRAARTKRVVGVGDLVPRYLREREATLRGTTYIEASRYLERYWKPIHAMAIEGVRRSDLVEVIDTIADEHGKVAADRARTALSAFFAWAIDRSYVDFNPVHNLQRRSQSAGRTRVLSEAELTEVWKACGEDDYGRNRSPAHPDRPATVRDWRPLMARNGLAKAPA